MTRRGTGFFICFILLQSVIYGIGNPLTKVAYESITPLWLLAVRYGMALILLALLFGRRIVACLRRTDWRLWLPSGFCCAGAFVAINVALSLTEATSVGFLMSLSVLFAPILSAVYLRRPYDRRSLPIQLVLVVGLFLLCCNGGAFSFGAGEALSLFAALCLAGILVFGERAMAEMDAVSFTAPQMAITFVVSLVGALLWAATCCKTARCCTCRPRRSPCCNAPSRSSRRRRPSSCWGRSSAAWASSGRSSSWRACSWTAGSAVTARETTPRRRPHKRSGQKERSAWRYAERFDLSKSRD